MSYTALALGSVVVVALLDAFAFRTDLLRRKVFWTSYAIIFFFQLLTNGVFTGARIVRYNGDSIIGSSTPLDAAPPFIGDGRLAFAPVEDLLFGFALVLLSLCLWVTAGRRGLQREPMAGPPRPFMARLLGTRRPADAGGSAAAQEISTTP